MIDYLFSFIPLEYHTYIPLACLLLALLVAAPWKSESRTGK